MTIRMRQFVIAFGLFTLVGLFFSTNLYLGYNYVQKIPLAWYRAIRSELIAWYLWGLLAIPVLHLARRVPFDRRAVRSVTLHLAAAVAASSTHLLIMNTWFWGVEGRDHTLQAWLRSLRLFAFMSFHWDVLTYAGILAFAIAWHVHRESRERQLRAVQLESRLTQARLGALESRLHPHFLFNTLNTITALIHDDPAAAERTIAKLGDLLRTVLRRELGQLVTLNDELEFARQYLEIEQTRFSDRLSVDWNVAPDAGGALVPSLLLQPLVENAIRHGVARSTGPCKIEIRAGRAVDYLHIEISNTAAGDDLQSSNCGAGEGLRNTRQRLAQQFGDRYSLALNRANGHCNLSLKIPFTTTPGDRRGDDSHIDRG